MPALDEERRKRKDEFNLITGTTIRHIRNERGMSQDGLARRADLSESHVSRIENGTRTITLQQAVSIAHALNVKLVDLMEPKLVRRLTHARLSKSA